MQALRSEITMKSIKPIYIALPVAIILAGAIAHRTLAQSSPIAKTPQNPSTMLRTGILEPVSDRTPRAETNKDRPVGGLYVQTTDRKQQEFTLTNTDVKGKISGNISRVEVTQTFQNP